MLNPSYMNDIPFDFDVFISYSHYDKVFANEICNFLETKKIRCWIAPRNVPPAVEFPKAIEYAIRHTEIFIIVCSNNSLRSQHVLTETNLAVSDKKILIPFLIEDCNFEGTGMRYFLNNWQWVNSFSTAKKVALNTLAKRIFDILNSKEKETGSSSQKRSSTDYLSLSVVNCFSASPQAPHPVRSQEVEYKGKKYSAIQIIKIADLQPWLLSSVIISNMSFLAVILIDENVSLRAIAISLGWIFVFLDIGGSFIFLLSRKAIKANVIISLLACVAMFIPFFNLFVVLPHILRARKILHAAGLKTFVCCVPPKELATFEKSV